MREIKFRVWDKIHKCFVADNRDLIIDDMGPCLQGNEYIEYIPTYLLYREIQLMQYTGMKDKNGKDIYEGDIVLYTNTYDFYGNLVAPAKGIIEYDQMSFKIKPLDPTSRVFFQRFHTVEKYPGLKIIGNIYENPELLNEEN